MKICYTIFMDNREAKIQQLKEYFETRNDIVMAFLFGSQAKERAHSGSDWDIAVYFTPQSKEFEFEESEHEYPMENAVWADCTRILGTDSVDLIVLNSAASTIANEAIHGLELVNKNRRLWLRFMLLITKLAEEYHIFAREYHEIVQRSRSLVPGDKDRLNRLIDFLEEQIGLYAIYKLFTKEGYEDNPRQRNEIERWLENITNTCIDIAKVILGSKKKLIPPTYRETMRRVIHILNLPTDFEDKFDGWVRLRNVLAHEYLDIKWNRISRFAEESEPYVAQYIKAAKQFLEKNVESIES